METNQWKHPVWASLRWCSIDPPGSQWSPTRRRMKKKQEKTGCFGWFLWVFCVNFWVLVFVCVCVVCYLWCFWMMFRPFSFVKKNVRDVLFFLVAPLRCLCRWQNHERNQEVHFCLSWKFSARKCAEVQVASDRKANTRSRTEDIYYNSLSIPEHQACLSSVVWS